MPLSKIYSAELEGVTARLIEVETDINIGLSSFTIVGLADKAVSEAKERVSSALKNCGIKPPTRENRKITVNLAPADIKKNGSQYDVAIALGYLIASEQIEKFNSNKKIFIGELALDGSIRPIPGVLNICDMAKKIGFDYVFIPHKNSKEASIIEGIKIIPVAHLREVIAYLEERITIPELERGDFILPEQNFSIDISEIKGQELAKRALSISAAGSHNLFMSGPPGAGKTMLAQALLSILPPITQKEALETSQIWSAAGMLIDQPYISSRPFRSPHHTASLISIIGGGQNPKPGEISLAHRGVLFLDEVPEFRRDVLESLRQPLESGKVVISRAKNTLEFPARFMLLLASNPCPCGYYQDEYKECKCSFSEIQRYQKKLSGPLLDRIDIHIWVNRIKSEDLKKERNKNESEQIKQKIQLARDIQKERFKKYNLSIFSNSELSSKQIEDIIKISPSAKKIADTMLDKAHLSARGYFKVIKIAQTIADMDGSEIIEENHLSEAFSYRSRLS